MEKFVNKLHADLEKRFAELGFETSINESGLPRQTQIGNTFRVLLPVTERGENILTQLRLGKLTDKLFNLQIYSTVFPKIDKNSSIAGKTDIINLATPVGAFGLFSMGDYYELYHKYSILIPQCVDLQSTETNHKPSMDRIPQSGKSGLRARPGDEAAFAKCAASDFTVQVLDCLDIICAIIGRQYDELKALSS